MASRALTVWGVEVSEESVACAIENAGLNGITNAAFFAGEVGRSLEELAERAGPPDVVVVDPPRAGLSGKALRALARLEAPRIVYVSCNPTTLAGNVKDLVADWGYTLERVRPVDMFPHTPHVESVSLRLLTDAGAGGRASLMIEGQEGVSWDDWVALARACEEHGLEGLFRSDHYQSVFDVSPAAARSTPGRRSPALAAVTERIRLGHDGLAGDLPAAVGALAHGRDRRPRLGRARRARARRAAGTPHEHEAHGFPFPDLDERMEILEEQLEIVHRQWTEEEFSFEGRHYRLERCRAEPKPLQKPHPPIVMGGGAGPRVARLAARWADEYNTPFASVEDCRERPGRIAQACEREGREPIVFSLMSAVLRRPRPRARRSSVPRRRLERMGRGRRSGRVPARRGQCWSARSTRCVARLARVRAPSGSSASFSSISTTPISTWCG